MLRSLLAALLLLALIPAAAAANASTWASRSVLDRVEFTAVVERALDTPEAESALAERLAVALVDTLVDVDDRVRVLLATVAGVAAGAPDAEIAAGLEPRILAALDDPRIESARREMVGSMHDALVGLDDPGSTVRLEGDTLILDAADLLRVMVDAVEPRVGQLGITIPASSSADVPIATAPGLAATSSALPTLDRAATVLPLLAIAMGLLVVVVAHRRSRAMRNVGVALALAGAGCLAIVWLGGLVATTADASLSPTLVRSTYDALSADLVQQSMLVAAAGGLLVLLGIVAGLLPTRHSSRRQGATDPW